MNQPNEDRFTMRTWGLTLTFITLLTASWLAPGPWQVAWHWIDHHGFLFLNGMIADQGAVGKTVALANHRAFDLIFVCIYFYLFWRYLMRGGKDSETMQQVIKCTWFFFYAVSGTIAAIMLGHFLPGLSRDSPAQLLIPGQQPTDWLPSLAANDTPNHSFPNARGTATLILGCCLVRCGGPRTVFAAITLAVLMTAPQIITGTSWISDVMVGSASIAILMTAITFATPLNSKLVFLTSMILKRGFPRCDELLRRSFTAQTPPLLAKGICMGTADIIPGVSGGTMAYILGIYPQLLAAITVMNHHWLRDVMQLRIRQALHAIPIFFLAPLGIGILIAVVIFTKIIPLPYFVEHHPEPVYSLFFGLVGGSVILLLRLHAKPCWRHGLSLLLGVAMGISIVSWVPSNTPDTPWFLFFCGALAISAMLLPGISGSFILLILGKYALILGAIGDLNLHVLVPFALGCGCGLLVFAHSLRWLMTHYPVPMNLIITGLLIGTMRAIWPFQTRIYADVNGKNKLLTSEPFLPLDPTAWISLSGIMMTLGFALIFILNRLSQSKHTSPCQHEDR